MLLPHGGEVPHARSRCILHAGGKVDRARTTAVQAVRFPHARVVISAQLNPAEVMALLEGWMQRSRLLFDYRPWDTLTHFTALRQQLRQWDITELRVVTDRYHVRRAVLCARIVLLGTGIRVVGVPHEDQAEQRIDEPWGKWLWDGCRALFYRCTGIVLYDAAVRKARRLAQAVALEEALALGLTVCSHPDSDTPYRREA